MNFIQFFRQLGLLIPFLIVFAPSTLNAQERGSNFTLDEFRGTCSELLSYVKNYMKEKAPELPIYAKQDAGTDAGEFAFTIVKLETKFHFIPKLIENKSGNPGVCLQMAELDQKVVRPVTPMRRIEWKHNWPEDSLCAKEWMRVVDLGETHERTHVTHAEELSRQIRGNLIQNIQDKFLSKNRAVFCDSTVENAQKKMGEAMGELISAAEKNFTTEYNKIADQFHAIAPKIILDCTKCKSYSFEGLNIHWKLKTSYDNGMEVVDPAEMILESEGRICGNPLETDRGYVLWGVDNKRPDKARVPWSKYRELHSDPIKAKAEVFGFPRFLSTNPPQFEWIVPSDYLNRFNPPNSRILDMQPIPPTPTARVPAIISEEPRGCEESQPQVKPVSSVPQVTKRLTGFTPLPTTDFLRCE